MSKSLQYVRDIVDNEGFEYAFIYYSTFKDVKDPEFQALRQKFYDAHQDLYDYLHENTRGEEDYEEGDEEE